MSRPAPLTITQSAPPLEAVHNGDHSTSEICKGDSGNSQDQIRSPDSARLPESSESQDAEEHCTCPPEHKIPRPENCFILFRSAHQKRLSAQEGNNQPGISQKLGDLWKKADPATKEYWRAEAEKKKALHKQRYPNYRYQPKLKGRNGRSLDEEYCNNCGKRLIGLQLSSPKTPPRTASPHTFGPNHNLSVAGHTTPRTSEPIHHMRKDMEDTRLDSAYGQGTSHAPKSSTPRGFRREPQASTTTIVDPSLPEFKRRRLSIQNDARQGQAPLQTTRVAYPPSPSNSGPPTASGRTYALPPKRGNETPVTSHPANSSQWKSSRGHFPVSVKSYFRGPPTPSPGATTPRVPNHGQNLPRISELGASPSHSKLMGPPMRRSHSGDREDVRLPPLQGPVEETRNGEAIATSIPFTDKVRRLLRVAPPLRTPNPLSPPRQLRGVLIAVEGDDVDAAQALAGLLASTLNQVAGKFNIKIEPGPKDLRAHEQNLSLRDHLNIIGKWHEKNKELVDYITTIKDDVPGADSAGTAGSARIPVLIIPNYQLRITDTYASRIPITDGYSPDEHYQHMVKLWRGIVGPDLTIYLRDVRREQLRLEVVQMIQGCPAMRIAKERGSQKLDEERVIELRHQVGAFIRKMAEPPNQIDLGFSKSI